LLAQVWERMSAQVSDDAAHDHEHCLRVATRAVEFASTAASRQNLIAAALLHDIVNVAKDSPQRAQASRLSAEQAREWLAAAGFEASAVTEICEAIEDHSFSRGVTPRSELGCALQDADRLEALGAIGIFRTASTGCRMGAAYFHAQDPWAQDRPLDDMRYSVDHFFTKLLTLPQSFCTAAGRKEAERRVRLMQAFLDALAEELGQPRPAQ